MRGISIINLLVAVAYSFFLIGCPDSAMPTSQSDSAGEALQFVIDGNSVDSALSLGYGETLTFSVSYNGDSTMDFSCAVVDSENDEFYDDSGGTVVCSDGAGTYTAPMSTPSEGSLVKVRVSIVLSVDTTSSSSGLTVDGYLEIQLPDISSTALCTTSTTCAEAEPGTFCYFGECVTYEYAGVDTSQTCDNDRAGSGDCEGEGVDWGCTPVAEDDCVDYCVDLDQFFEDSPSQDECGEGNWEEGYGVCVTNDMMSCDFGNSGDGYDDNCEQGSYTCEGCSDIGGTWNLWSSLGESDHGLAYYDGRVWALDNSNAQIHKLDLSGNIDSSISYPNPSSQRGTGIAFDGSGNLWVAKTDGPSMIYKLDPTDGAVLDSFRSPGGDSTGLTFINGYIWNAGFNKYLYKVNPSNGSLLDTYISPGCGPEGLAYDGTYIWHVDIYAEKVFKINPSTGSAVAVGDSPVNSPIGLTYDSVNKYVYVTGQGYIYRMYIGD